MIQATAFFFIFFLAQVLSLCQLEGYFFTDGEPPKKLVIAMYAHDRPPFFLQDAKGEMSGFDIELAYKIAKELNIPLEINHTAQNFDEVIAFVAEGKANIGLSKLSNTVSRSKKVVFTNPYIKLKRTLIVHRLKMAQLHRGSNPLVALDSAEITIGVLSGSSYFDYAKELLPKAQIAFYPDTVALFDAVKTGEIYAIMLDNSLAQNLQEKNSENALILQTEFLTDKEDPIAIALPSNDFHLWYWLNVFLAKNHQQLYTTFGLKL